MSERSGALPPLRSSDFGAGWAARVEGWSATTAYVFLGCSLGAVAFLDIVTDHAAFSAFYLLPVGVAAWRFGRGSGLFWAYASAAVWLGVEFTEATGSLTTELWTGAVALATYVALALALAALRTERDAVRALSGADPLTEVHTRRSFQMLVEREVGRALRYNRPFTLAYLDVDGFRAVNQRWGHTAGDRILRLLARTMGEKIRAMDTVARMGGDEFALLFPETGQGAAEAALGKIQTRLTEVSEERGVDLTFSIGGVICVGAPQSVEHLIQRSEGLMYAAKKAGGGLIKTEVLDENFGIEAILQRS